MAIRDFLAFAKQRHSAHDYADKAIPANVLNYVLEAGRWSPSCHNTQPWKFVVVKNKKRILGLVDSSTSAAFVIPPPQLVALVLDVSCLGDSEICASTPEGGRMDAYLCLGTAAMSMAYAAEAKGWNCSFLTPDPVKAGKILGVKSPDTVALLVLLGKERKGVFQKPKVRKALKEIVRRERA